MIFIDKKYLMFILLFLSVYSSFYFDLKNSQDNSKTNLFSHLFIDFENLVQKDSKNIIINEERRKNIIRNNSNILSKDNINNYISYDLLPISNNNLNLQNINQVQYLNNYYNLWNRINKILPEKYINKISKMEIFTDGKDNTLAYVTEDKESNYKWKVAFDIQDCYDFNNDFNSNFDKTLVHEFMHIISLENCQMKDKSLSNNNTLILPEGCLKEDSYLNLFYNKFWYNHKSYIDLQELNTMNQKELSNLQINFYLNHKNEFISMYAALNPVEDIAETFINFIFFDLPIGNSIKEEKIKFLYNFSELVDIRNYIRKNLELSSSSSIFIQIFNYIL